MARSARVVAVYVAHHVTQRRNARQVILSSDGDRVGLPRVAAASVVKFYGKNYHGSQSGENNGCHSRLSPHLSRTCILWWRMTPESFADLDGHLQGVASGTEAANVAGQPALLCEQTGPSRCRRRGRRNRCGSPDTGGRRRGGLAVCGKQITEHSWRSRRRSWRTRRPVQRWSSSPRPKPTPAKTRRWRKFTPRKDAAQSGPKAADAPTVLPVAKEQIVKEKSLVSSGKPQGHSIATIQRREPGRLPNVSQGW